MATNQKPKVKDIKTDSDFQKELTLAEDRLVVVDFYATWCDPCKKIAPRISQYSMKYISAIFLKVDVDICSNTAKRYDVRSMPTILFFRQKEKLDQVVGADESAIESGILKHIGTVSGEGTGESEVNAVNIPGQVNINSVINLNGSECLNESDNNTFRNALSRGRLTYLESDCDEQLIIALSFTQPIKLHSLQLIAPSNGTAPKTIKIFINQTYTLDFDSAEANKPIETLSLTEDDVNDDSVIPLMYLKYQNVSHLTMFIKDNQGGEETTVIQYIGLYGSLLDSTNMKEFKRVSGDKGEQH